MARIERHTAGVDAAGFAASELVQDAVIRNLEVIGEAANNIQRVDPAFTTAHPQVPWAVMYAMRNRLTHGYDTVDMAVHCVRPRPGNALRWFHPPRKDPCFSITPMTS